MSILQQTRVNIALGVRPPDTPLPKSLTPEQIACLHIAHLHTELVRRLLELRPCEIALTMSCKHGELAHVVTTTPGTPARRSYNEFTRDYYTIPGTPDRKLLHIEASAAAAWFAAHGEAPGELLKAWFKSQGVGCELPELTPTPYPAPAAPPEAVLMPAQAVPVVAESAPNLDNCLPTPQVATVFDGVPFTARRWTNRLSDAKWLQVAKRSAGEQGGVPAMWCPLALAQAIHSHKKGATTLKSLNSLFRRNELLAPHRDAWDEYFELMRND